MSQIVSTSAGATSNCYISLADADTYFDDTLREEEWNFYGDSDKERGLIAATKQIERQLLDGTKSDTDTPQALHFPRSTDYDDDSNYVIPQDIEDATCEQALYLLNKKTSPDLLDRRALQHEGVEEINLDGYREKYRRFSADNFSPEAKALLSPYLIHQARVMPRGRL